MSWRSGMPPDPHSARREESYSKANNDARHPASLTYCARDRNVFPMEPRVRRHHIPECQGIAKIVAVCVRGMVFRCHWHFTRVKRGRRRTCGAPRVHSNSLTNTRCEAFQQDRRYPGKRASVHGGGRLMNECRQTRVSPTEKAYADVWSWMSRGNGTDKYALGISIATA